MKLRLPRILLAIVIGGALAVSGTVFQAVLKNPLADPYIIGVSGGAALGATAAIVLNAAPGVVAAAAFAGSIAIISIVYLLSKRMRARARPPSFSPASRSASSCRPRCC